MSKIIVHHLANANETPSSQFNQILADALRRRAYELFEQRDCAPGGELDDWFRAESDLILIPPTEVKETAKAFNVKITAPGFTADDIEVIAGEKEIIVEARTEIRRSASQDRGYRFFTSRFDTASPIRTEKVTATFDDGKLTIQAPKKVQAVPAQAAAA